MSHTLTVTTMTFYCELDEVGNQKRRKEKDKYSCEENEMGKRKARNTTKMGRRGKKERKEKKR